MGFSDSAVNIFGAEFAIKIFAGYQVSELPDPPICFEGSEEEYLLPINASEESLNMICQSLESGTFTVEELIEQMEEQWAHCV